MGYNEQRWTGVMSAIYWHCKNLLDGKETEKIPRGYLAGIKRFIDLAINGMGPQHLVFGMNHTFEAIHCFQIAVTAMLRTKLAETPDEVKNLLTEFKGLLAKIDTADPVADKVALEKAAQFFGQILHTGEQERYIEYVRGNDDDDD